MFVGPWGKKYDGFNEHVMRSAVSLSDAGETVQLIGRGPEVSDDPHFAAAVDLSRTRVASPHTVVCMTIFDPDVFRRALQLPPACNKVIYTVFERDKISVEEGEVLRRADQVWVACQDNAAALVEGGVPSAAVKVVPCPYREDDPLLGLRGRARKPGPPRFYHIGKHEPRKAQELIVAAFMRAFRPGEAELYLRCGRFKDDGVPLASVAALLAASPSSAENGWGRLTLDELFKSVVVLGRPLTEEGLLQLHAVGDVYVSLSRGEGFDMPAFDSKLAGKRLIYTETAARDFAGGDDVLVPRTGSMPTHPVYGWTDATYGRYDLDAASEAMVRTAAEVKSNARPVPLDMSRWSSPAVGRLMRSNLSELQHG